MLSRYRVQPFLAPFESTVWSALFATAVSIAIGVVAYLVAQHWWVPRQRAKLGMEPFPSVKSDPRVKLSLEKEDHSEDDIDVNSPVNGLRCSNNVSL